MKIQGQLKTLFVVIGFLIAVSISACGDDNGPGPDKSPILSVSIDTLDFDTMSTSRMFTISNSGDADLSWSLTSDNSSWLESISPDSGTILDDSSEVTVTIDRAGLASGTYNAKIYVSSNGGSDTIAIIMDVPAVLELVLTLPQISTTECQTIEAPITVVNFIDIGGVQLNIQYDTLRITYDSVTTGYLDGATINASSGIIHIVWADISGTNPVTIPDGDSLAIIHFSDLSGISQLAFTGYNTIGDAYGETVTIELTDGSAECTVK